MNKIIRRNLNCVLSIFVCLSNMQMVYAEEYIPEEQEEENEVSAAETEVIEETIEEEVVVKSYDEAYGDFTYTVKNNAVTITGYTGSDTSITIPGEIDGNPVTNISYYAFRNHTELTKVVFEENLENIYTGAFQGCTNLKEVTFPDSLTFIENDGFKDCPIENLQLPKNINKLGFDSFSNNPNLTSIYLPASLSSVSDGSPFKGCENLKEIYFEEGFKSIPNYLFDGTLIEEIELPEGIESTGMYSFRNCEKLTKVIFPSTIKQIDSHSFENDISLQQITLNDGLKTIWSYAFAGCVNLKQVRFPETITYIDCMAFNSCPFEDLVLPAKIVNLNYACFGDNPNLTSVFIPSTLASCWGHSPFTGCENLQEVLFEEGTVKIPDRLFQSAMIEKIVIPEGIETIGEYAFKNCENLKEVQFPSTLKMIDMYAFEEDPALEEIVLNEGLEEIEYYGFRNCTNLRSVSFPSTLENIGNEAFMNCPIQNLILPENVKYLGDNSFANNPDLTTITIPSTTVAIGYNNSPFTGCENLEEVIFEDGLEQISPNAFQDFEKITNITFPDSIKTIFSCAFDGCPIEDLKLPANIERLDAGCFGNNPNLTSITIPSTLKLSYGQDSPFVGCENLAEVYFEEGLEIVPDYMFQDFENITNVKFPDSLKRIGKYAFENCPIENFELSENIEELGQSCFGNNLNITSVTLSSTLNSVSGSDSPFSGCDNLRNVVLEDGMKILPKYILAYTGIEKIDLPIGMETIQDYALLNCENLKTISVPDTVKSIASSALQGTDVDLFLTNYDTYGVTYAISHGIKCEALNSKISGSDLIDRNTSTYYAYSDGLMLNGTVPVTIDVNVKDEYKGNLYDRHIHVYIPEGVTVNLESATFNGQAVKYYYHEYYMDNGGLVDFSLNEDCGTLRFSFTLNVEDKKMTMDTYAVYMAKTSEGKQYTDTIGSFNDFYDGVIINAPEMTRQESFAVSGIAPAGSEIELYVDDVLQDTVIANKNSKWYGTVTIDDPVNYMPYYVTASKKDSEEENDTAEAMVTYCEATPEVEAIDLIYYNHTGKHTLDILNNKRASFFKTTDPYHFEISLANDASVGKVYVNSTKGSDVRKMEAVYDEETGKYIAEGWFGDNPAYTAGKLTVSYTSNDEGNDISIDDLQDYFGFSPFANALDLGGYNKITKTENGEVIEVDMGSAYKDFEGEIAKIIYQHDSGNYDGVSVFDAFDIAEDSTNLMKVFIKDLNSDDYFLNWEFKSPDDVVLNLGKVADPTLKLVNDVHTLHLELPKSLKISDISKLASDSSKFKKYSKYVSFIYKTAKIYDKDEELRTKILYDTKMTQEQKKQALKNLDSLTTDKEAFLAITTIGAAAIKAGAASTPYGLVALGMIAGLKLISDLCFDMREKELLLGSAYLKTMIDPSGYVYDYYTEERLEDVKASAYWIEYDYETDEEEFFANKPSDDEYGELWNAEEYEQINPQMTDEEGRYQWDVPTGWWRVKYEREGYATTWSEWMPVPPPQLEVNIPLVPDVIPVTGITFKQSMVELTQDETFTPELIIEPENAVDKSITWISSNEEIATVDNTGKVTALKEGEAEITATSSNGKKAVCKVTVQSKREYRLSAWEWSEDFKEAKAVFTDRYNSEYNEKFNAVVTIAQDADRNEKYIATVIGPDGKEYTDERTKEKQKFQFNDVTDPNLSYYDPVYWAVENEITTGTSKEPPMFSPGSPCTRAQFVTFLWRQQGKPEPTTANSPFTDVQNPELSYYKAVLWAFEKGITTGTSDTTFSPGNPCTRAQVVTFLWRANNKPEPKTTQNPFTDVASGLSYSKAVLWAYENKITTGTSTTTFTPGKACTRAQTVTFLYRTYTDQ